MEQKKIVGIWIRVSTDMQVDRESPEHHEMRARLYAEHKSWHIAKIYRLDAMTGKSVMAYSETKQMLVDIKNKVITGLIFSELSRLARNTKELLTFADYFEENNADLISLSDSIDTTSPAGRFLYTIIGAVGEFERRQTAQRVSASVPIRARLAKPLGGQATFGYEWVDGKLVINEAEAPIRKLVHEFFAVHKRKKKVARLLNEQGFRTRGNALFTNTTIGRLLADPTAKGQRRANYTKSTGDNKKWDYKPQEEWIIVPCPAIVDEELWNECNRILDAQYKPRMKPTKVSVHMFTSILYCTCGAKMNIPSKSTKYICVACRQTRIEESDLEEIYYQNLKSFLLTQDHLTSHLTKADETINGKKEQLQSLNAELKKVRENMDKMLDLYMSGEIAKEGFGNRHRPLAERAEQIQASMPQIEAEIDLIRIHLLNSTQIQHDAHSLYDRWPTLPIEAKRDIAEEITESITIGGDEIHIKFSYNPTLTGNNPDWERNLTDSYSPPT